MVAKKIINLIFPNSQKLTNIVRQVNTDVIHFDFDWEPNEIDKETEENLRNIIWFCVEPRLVIIL